MDGRAGHPQIGQTRRATPASEAIVYDMSLLPDPATLRALADRIDDHAGAARGRADRLAAAVAAAGWRGLAADAFRAESSVAVAALRSAAGRLEGAADALRRHARAVAAIGADLTVLAGDGLRAAGDLVRHPGDLLGDAGAVGGDVISLADDGLHLVGIG